jgi:hypothetical protein
MVKGEQQLWCAVIEQALIDASSPLVPNRVKRFEQVRARDWFLGASRDFKKVCALAGMEWDRIRSVAIEKIEAARPHDAPIKNHQRVALQKRRRNRAKLYEHDGCSLTVYQWAAKTGISINTISSRLKSGMTISEAITTPRYAKWGGAVVDNFPNNAGDQSSPSTQDIP